jgi:hypothetical protein
MYYISFVRKVLISIIVFAMIFSVSNIVLPTQNVMAGLAEGTATISDGDEGAGAGVTATFEVSDVFTVVLTVGVSGIATDAESPTFDVPVGFTMPHATGGAVVPTQVSEVDADGEWFAAGAGGTCAVDMATSFAAATTIIVDVTGACSSGNTITLTYKGYSEISGLGATEFIVSTDVAFGGGFLDSIVASPTITVPDTTAPVISEVTPLTGVSVIFVDTVGYTVDEELDAGSITFIRTGGTADTQGTHEYSLTGADLIEGAHEVLISTLNADTGSFASGNELVDGTIYTMQIDAEDTAGNPAVQVEVLSITFTVDTVDPVISLVTPLTGTSVTGTDTVGYTLSEEVGSGTIVFTRTGGTADVPGIHIYEFTGVDTGVGAHEVLVDLVGALVHDTVYTMQIDADDPSGNAATQVEVLSITYDADNVAPTFTADRNALNTITLMFDEPVSALTTPDTDSFTVAGASSVSAVDNLDDTFTLTTVGLTATDGTPEVNYVAASGDITDDYDNAPVDGGAVLANDFVAPTFTADRNALNTVVLTFSEAVSAITTPDTDSFTVAGASSVSAVDNLDDTFTLTTVGLTATDGTPEVNYVDLTGDISDAAAGFPPADGGAVMATDGVSPTVTTLTPTDGGTDVLEDSNFVIVFSEDVDVESGNIVIKKLGDNSVVETIDVTSGQVTGTGTDTITINPTFDFEGLVDYYIQVDATAFDDTASNSYTGITDTTSWNFKSFNVLGSTNVIIRDPKVKVLYPKGGESLVAKETIKILWSTENYPSSNDASIYIQHRVGEDFKLIDTVKASLGVYEWVVPEIESRSANMKIVLSDSTDMNNGYSDYVFSVVPAGTVVVPPVVETPAVTKPVVKTPVVKDPVNTKELLLSLKTESKPEEFARYLSLVQFDASAFKVVLTEEQNVAITNFVTYGVSSETVKLGSGERRAVVRDYFETVGRAEIVWEDIQRITTGQKPVNRNLGNEQAKVGRVLENFIMMTGHAPNFEDPAEDIAWNTMMYRIRFPRDLKKEGVGIGQFQKTYRRSPSSPLEWSIVRALGYVLN